MKRFKHIFSVILAVILTNLTTNVTAQDFSGYQTPDISVQNSRVNEDATSWLDSVDISLLTCGPGNEVWSYYGHSALRIQDKMHGSDVAGNWGMFSFRQNFFILRFVFGLTDYQIGIYPMPDFLADRQRTPPKLSGMPKSISIKEAMGALGGKLVIGGVPKSGNKDDPDPDRPEKPKPKLKL